MPSGRIRSDSKMPSCRSCLRRLVSYRPVDRGCDNRRDLHPAQDLGLGSVWIQVRDRFDAEGVPADENIQGILGIPDTISVECVVAIGYPDEAKNPQNLEKLLWERVHIGGWNPEQTQA